MPIPRLDCQHTGLLVVDVQEKLLPHMHNADSVVDRVGRLIDGAVVLGLPVLVTEQYRKGLGVTVAELAGGGSGSGSGGGGGRLGGAVCNVEKTQFSSCVDQVREQLTRLNLRSVIVCGIEAHVCVLQTCLDLVEGGYVTAVAADAIGSRRQVDQNTALMRMTQVGVVPVTVESALLELVKDASGSQFKAILPIIR